LNKVYSWGFGENYVLGTLNDENEVFPHNVNPKMFEEKQVHQIALGTQHVVVLASDDKELPEMKLDEFVPPENAPVFEDDKVSVRSGRSRKSSNHPHVFS
jgi:hypothetical protein